MTRFKAKINGTDKTMAEILQRSKAGKRDYVYAVIAADFFDVETQGRLIDGEMIEFELKEV